MGLFFNYIKPGPGVDKNAPQKKGIFRFFEIFGRKLGMLIKLNMLYFVCSLPMLLLLFFFFSPTILGLIENVVKESEIVSEFHVVLTMFFTVTAITLLGSGPASAAAAYIERSFFREEHVWLMSDFFEKFKENFKQAIIVSIISIVAMVASFFAIKFYFRQYFMTGSMIWFILTLLLGFFILLFALMHCYIYQLMVTFENKLFDLYKNAAILTLSTFPFLLIIALIVTIIAYFIYTPFAPTLTLMLSFLFVLMYLRFPLEYYAASVIKKKVLDPISEENANEQTTKKADDACLEDAQAVNTDRSDN